MDLLRVADELASAQGGVLARRQLLAAGVNPSTLHQAVVRGRLEQVCRGVLRLPGSPRSEMQRLWVAHLRVGPESVLAYGSAARLWGLKSIEQCRPTLLGGHWCASANRAGAAPCCWRSCSTSAPEAATWSNRSWNVC